MYGVVQIEQAFEPGYDPALELARQHTTKKMDYDENGEKMEEEVALEDPWTSAMRRKEQDLVDRIIQGEESGHYFVLLGPKVRNA